MAFYRSKFPSETVTPKLHLLEDHAIQFMRKWGSSFGLYGEQGAESIHAAFNRSKLNYVGMKKNTERLEAMLRDHFSKVYPKSVSMRPEIKKRKVSEE